MVNLNSEYSTGLCFEGQISVKFSRTWLNDTNLSCFGDEIQSLERLIAVFISSFLVHYITRLKVVDRKI